MENTKYIKSLNVWKAPAKKSLDTGLFFPDDASSDGALFDRFKASGWPCTLRGALTWAVAENRTFAEFQAVVNTLASKRQVKLGRAVERDLFFGVVELVKDSLLSPEERGLCVVNRRRRFPFHRGLGDIWRSLGENLPETGDPPVDGV